MENREEFYRQMIEHCKNVVFESNPNFNRNHMRIKRIEGLVYSGYVNWYFQEAQIIKYSGNVCVVFEKANTYGNIPEGFRPHTNNRIIASITETSVDKAAKWACETIWKLYLHTKS